MRLRYLYLTLIFSFLLGTHEGFVTLWKIPQKEPAVVFPYRVSSLPAVDRQHLQKGISVKTKEELMILLEDYLS